MSERLSEENKENLDASDQDEIHLLDVLVALGRQKKIMFGTPIVIGTLSLLAALFMSPIFLSTAVILPPQQEQNMGVSAVLGQLGGLGGGLKNPNDLYIGMLQSRTIADKIIIQFDLKERFEVKTFDEARKILSGISEIVSDKSSTISVKVENKDAKFAAELANAYVNELSKLTQTLALSDSSRRRAFFEKQLNTAKEDLADAEVVLRKTQEKTGMLQLDGQVKGIIDNVAQLEATIGAKNVQLRAMRSFATVHNPDYLRLQEEIRGLAAQLESLKSGNLSKDGDLIVPTGKIPEVGVEYIRSLRNLKYYETIFDLLAKQYELAKIAEAKDSSTVQILDQAVPAEKKLKPKRLLIVLAGFFGGGMLGLLLALLRESYLKSRRSSTSNYRWKLLANAWVK